MKIRLGEKIRDLRKEKNLSQEALANVLGVTFQAVSKWETETAMPDVTLIPAIASFFGVSTDELFDFDRYETERKVREICEESWKCRESEPEKAEAILREGLKKYPGNDVILNNLLYVMTFPERAEEAIELCRALIQATKLDDVRLDAWRIMAEAYQSLGEYGQCKAAIEQIPEIYFTKLQLDAELLEGEDMFESAQKQKRLSADWTVDMLFRLADYYEANGEPDRAAVQLRIARQVIEAFREDFPVKFFRCTVWEGRQETRGVIEERLKKLGA